MCNYYIQITIVFMFYRSIAFFILLFFITFIRAYAEKSLNVMLDNMLISSVMPYISDYTIASGKKVDVSFGNIRKVDLNKFSDFDLIMGVDFNFKKTSLLPNEGIINNLDSMVLVIHKDNLLFPEIKNLSMDMAFKEIVNTSMIVIGEANTTYGDFCSKIFTDYNVKIIRDDRLIRLDYTRDSLDVLLNGKGIAILNKKIVSFSEDLFVLFDFGSNRSGLINSYVHYNTNLGKGLMDFISSKVNRK